MLFCYRLHHWLNASQPQQMIQDVQKHLFKNCNNSICNDFKIICDMREKGIGTHNFLNSFFSKKISLPKKVVLSTNWTIAPFL